MFAATPSSKSSTFLMKNNQYYTLQRHYPIINNVFLSSRPNGMRIMCCSDDSTSSAANSKRGFGPQPSTSSTNNKTIRIRRSPSQSSGSNVDQAPGLRSQMGGKQTSIVSDLDFEERLRAVKRSALEQKKIEEEKQYGAIDYDAPVETKSSTIGLGTKIGVGIAVVVFGLVFALGDFLPSGSVGPSEESAAVNKISEEERAILQKRLLQFESTLDKSPEDTAAIEGAAVTLVELGEYKRAASLLEDLTKNKPSDPEVYRLLGEVKYELKDYDGSATAYRNSAKVSKTTDFQVLRGLTNALLAAKKPDEAVQILLASRTSLSKETSKGSESIEGENKPEMDPIQVDLLLGKAYSDWGHVSDAVSVYDQLIANYPDDFRGYLAKGIILKQNGNSGDAERMFIQARFFAPEKAKALVDKFSR
ncbi:hypothetical protein LIER_36304 [Lithospermum erythrorhizon]|uniref:Tetratricopeptide repeat (TPR)-like superfamily protein n=1 Tax=Lithospermum erythrorhizon TaxID=34254 RepID=A0AAV3P5C3_LITER